MPISQKRARELCSKDEFGVVRTSFRDELRNLTLAEARKKAKHTKKLYAKWSTLAERQDESVAKRAKKTNAAAERGEGSPRETALKAKIFKEALNRYEKYEAKLERQARQGKQAPEAAEEKSGLRELFAKRESDRAKRMREESAASKFARKVQHFGRSYSPGVGGHIRVLGQMKQGKRDARR